MQAVWIQGGDMMGHPMLGRQSGRNCPTWVRGVDQKADRRGPRGGVGPTPKATPRSVGVSSASGPPGAVGAGLILIASSQLAVKT